MGFDWAVVQQSGVSVGMRSMQARIAAHIGGLLQLQSQPGGTLLTVGVTLQSAAPAVA